MNRLPAVQIAYSHCVDLNRRIRKGVDSEDRPRWWSVRKVLGEYAIHRRICVDLRQICLDIDHVVESQSRRLQDALDIVEGLPELRD